MDVIRADVVIQEILRHFLRHALRQRRYKHTLVALRTHKDFLHQVVYLILARTHLYLRIQ